MEAQSFFSIKKFLPHSLLGRSLLILTLPIILILIISTYVFFERHWERMTSRLAVAVAGEVSFLVEAVRRNPDDPTLTRDALKHMQLSVQYFEGNRLQGERENYIGRGAIIRNLLYHELSKKLEHPFRIVVDTDEKYIQIQVALPDGILMVTSPEKRLFSSSGYAFLLYMIGVATFLMVIAILFMRNQIRPIKRLAIAAERFGKGRDVAFFKIEGASDVRQAARAFLGMRERLNRQIQQRTAMLSGVSHDLRTPLTRIKLQASMLPDSADKTALLSDVAEMEKMIHAYLQFARGEGQEEVERVKLSAVIMRLEENFRQKNFDIQFIDNSTVDTLFLRPVAMERCLSNLISNARKYSGKLEILMESDKDNVTLTLSDDGQGIAPEAYEDVFKPFYREETSRNQKTGGVGLGLPIAKDIILSHGGTIALGQSRMGGLQVMITLPL